MIDFRYHLVSIVAVFLALAIGIVVGAEALSPKFANQLNKEAQSAVKNNAQLSARNDQLSRQISADNAFAQAASGYLLAHLLDGERVVLVAAPGADSATVSGIRSALRRAGATVTGQVSLTGQFFDPGASTEQALTSLASSLTPPGVSLPGPAPAGVISGQQAAARLIAAALVSKDGLAALTSEQSRAAVNGLGQQGFLQIAGPGGGPALDGQATLAVVVTPASPPGPGNSTAGPALIALTQDLQVAGQGTVLAGSVQGSGAGSAIGLVTAGNAGVALTTVDDADTAIGQLTVVQALRRWLSPHATPASYGVRTGTVPSPAPSTPPSPSPSPSPSPTRSAKAKTGTPSAKAAA